MRQQLGLDQPLPGPVRPFLWGVAREILASRSESGEQVRDLIVRNLPFTIQLAVVSLGVAVLIGFVLG